MLNFHEQGDRLSYCGQINPAQVPELAAAGYRSIICNRPDGEEGAIASAAIAKAASEHGLAFVYQPVDFSKLSLADGEVFVQALEQLPAPVLAYCRTGRRSAALWVLGRAPKLGADQVLAGSLASGCDLEDLRPRLSEFAPSTTPARPQVARPINPTPRA
jgi:sulfide:quinone oxidoreductase